MEPSPPHFPHSASSPSPSQLTPTKRLRLSFPSSPPPPMTSPSPPMTSPTPPLPPSIETSLADIYLRHNVPRPSANVLRGLARVGEDRAREILLDLRTFKRVNSLDGLIMHLLKRFSLPLSPAKVPFDGGGSPSPPPRPGMVESPVFAPPSPSLFARTTLPGDRVTYSSPGNGEVSISGRMGPTDHLVALGELEFRRSFLILSYIGKLRVEDIVSIDLIRSLKFVDMVTFEREIWQAFGRVCIPQSDRILGLDWYADKTYMYPCYVDSEGKTSFKGPYLQPTKTHLQRVLGDDMVMLVKFEGEGSVKDDVYESIIRDGIFVGLRRYRFFVYKDGGKEERKKSSSSSSVRCYFVCTESSCSIDENGTYILFNKTINEARSIFMHVHMVTNMAKYMARFSLILSKTAKLDVDLDTVNIIDIDDIDCRDEKGLIVRNPNEERMILTDGTGFISEDLALMCPLNVFKGHYSDLSNNQVASHIFRYETSCLPSTSVKCPPLLIQCRIFHKGRAIKGTLLVNKKLPPRTIHVRPSMIKVSTDLNIQSSHCENSFEIVATSNHPKRSFLSRTLIALLHYGGVPENWFMRHANAALNEMQYFRVKKKSALQVSLRYGDIGGELVTRMIMCGIPLDEPYLAHRLQGFANEDKKGLSSGRIPVDNSFYLMGTTDPTETLKPNEVCVILEQGHLSGEVLVYRNPGSHFGDIHRLRATYVEELEEFVGNSKYGIFFSSKGPRSIADEIAGGDYDGDMYWVSNNQELVQKFKPCEPWTENFLAAQMGNIEKPSDYSEVDLEKELFQQFLSKRFQPNFTMSKAADSWLSYMDRLLTLKDDCKGEKESLKKKIVQLIDIYYAALDAPKSGKQVDIPWNLLAEKFPHYMEKKVVGSFQSTSVLGKIYDMVKETEALPSQEVWKLPCFEAQTVSTNLLDKWGKRYAEYRGEMRAALEEHEGNEEAKNAAAERVKLKYKQELYEAPEFEKTQRPKEEIFAEALAIYHVVYNHAEKIEDVKRCCFAWDVAGRALCAMHASLQQKSDTIPCLRSVLGEIFGDRH